MNRIFALCGITFIICNSIQNKETSRSYHPSM